VRSLYRQVLSEPADADAWRRLADGFARRGHAGRAAACLDALEAAAPAARARDGDADLRRRAQRESLERRRRLVASLLVPDATRVSVVVVGEPGRADTGRTLECLGRQRIDGLDVHVVSDRSEGLRRATGRYVAHLDAGDEIFPDHLEVLADHLDRTGRALTFSRALTPGPGRPRATDGAPVLPRQTAAREFAPAAAVLHRRRAVLDVGGFEPHLGRAQAWHLWSRFVERTRADAVPVLSARVAGDDASPERRFDLLLVRLGNRARAHRSERKGRGHLARGDVDLAARAFGRAWNLGLPVETYVRAIASLAEQSRRRAGDLVALGAGEVEPHVRGPFRRIARGAEARRILALRMHRHALRTLYREADARGRETARRLGWNGDVG
jgi:hypothetical protein